MLFKIILIVLGIVSLFGLSAMAKSFIDKNKEKLVDLYSKNKLDEWVNANQKSILSIILSALLLIFYYILCFIYLILNLNSGIYQVNIIMLIYYSVTLIDTFIFRSKILNMKLHYIFNIGFISYLTYLLLA